MQAKPFGAVDAKDYVPGAEVLAQEDDEEETFEIESSNDDSDSDSDWVDVSESENEDETKDEDKNQENDVDIVKKKAEVAAQTSIGRLLTDEDFKKIETAQLRKQVTTLPRGVKRSLEESGTRYSIIFINI